MTRHTVFEPIAWRRSYRDSERTWADDIADSGRAIDSTPHPHFHAHGGGGVHLHQHQHPDDLEHAHSARKDWPRHA